MAFGVGSKCIKRLCLEQHPLGWQKAKLAAHLFKPYEQDIYAWVSAHLKAFHALPHVDTLITQFPEMAPIEVPEPSAYYVQLLENQYFYDRINRANLDAQQLLKEDQNAHVEALAILKHVVREVTEQKYRLRILDVGMEAQSLVMTAYHQVNLSDTIGVFGWPYMDTQSGGVMPGDVVSFVGRPAVGKSQPLDAQVLTISGFKRMGDIALHDQLASVDGAPSQVIGVYPQGLQHTYRITFQDGRSTEASDEHLWEVYYRTWKAPRILTTLQLSAKLKAKRYRQRLSIRLCAGHYGAPITVPFSPYLLGCLLGDGGFTARDYIRFTTGDDSLVKRLGSELRMQGLDLKYMDRYDYAIVDERQPSQDRMKQWIARLGLRFHKSEEKFIPSEYLQADHTTRAELLRGLMDTDGTAEQNGATTYSSSSRILAEQVVYLVRSLGGRAYISDKATECLPHYRVNIVFEDRASLFTLERKRQRVQHERTTHTNHRLVIDTITYVGEKECQCLAVSHPSHLYLTDEFIVTHNTWLTLWTAIQNWIIRKLNVLYVSMEMMTLPIAQRIAAIYTHHNIQQLKTGAFSSPTFSLFLKGLKGLSLEQAKFYVIDGNLAANVEDIFVMADMLQCPVVIIDGAYLLRHKNIRLDRFHRAAENVELIKRHCTDLDMMAFCSWQFNREASKKQKKGTGEKGDLEDIGYSDAIGQISSIALSLFQEDTVETLKERKVQVMKGRNGEIGQFSIHWDFSVMNFSQAFPPLGNVEHEASKELQWL